MGRPFVGNVSDKKGREDHVIVRRSVFRQLKHLFGREDYITLLAQFEKVAGNLENRDRE